jgi:hypothetical protein
MATSPPGQPKKRATKANEPARRTTPSTTTAAPADPPVRLLSGGNPQIPKGDGDGPVEAYLAAMPGWKSDVGRRLDAIVVDTVPNVRKAVKWNSPFYGRPDGDGWFLNFHCFTKYVKVAFFNGSSLAPEPPGPSKDDQARYLDIYEHDEFDEATFRTWIEQANRLPGWTP